MYSRLSQELARSIKNVDSNIQKVQENITSLSIAQNRKPSNHPKEECWLIFFSGQSSRQRSQYNIDVLKWLAPVAFAERHGSILQQIQPGTGMWLLKNEAFLQCMINAGPLQTLWMAGIPGSGKTFLATLVIHHLESTFTQPDVGVSYVYWDYKDTGQTMDSLKRIIMRQLLHRVDDLPEDVKKLYEIHAKRSTLPSTGELDDALTVVCERFQRIFIVVDALDEATGINNPGEALLKLCKNLSPRVRTLVTSRHTAGLMRDMQEARCIEVSAKDQDITAYIRHEIVSRTRLQQFVTKEPAFEEHIIQRILEKCKGMFLIARLHIELLAAKPHLRAAKIALDQLPTDLYNVYESTLERIRKQSEEDFSLAWRVLTWTVKTTKRLRAEQIQHALAVELDYDGLDDDALIEMDLILSVCAGLVVIDPQDSTVRLVHYTAQEYFETQDRCLLRNADFEIAQICLKYLSFSETAGVSLTDNDLSHKLAAFPFLEYAAVNWGTHVSRSSGESSELDDQVEIFLCNDTLVAGAVQAMFVPTWRHKGFSQNRTTGVQGLHLAAHSNLTRAMKKLFDNSEPEVRDSAGRTPLHWASRAGHVDIVKLLLDRGVDVDALDNVRGTPLHLASRFGYVNVVFCLIENGCDVNKRNNVGGTALAWAAIGGASQIANSAA